MNNTAPSSETNYAIPFITSPLFPLLYLSLLHGQRYTPNTTMNILPKYDYIIVGAGSAGSALATRLSEISCVTVLLLEAGDTPPYVTEIPVISQSFIASDLDWGYSTAPQKFTARLLKNRKITYPRGKAVGGTSVINGNLYVRGSRHIYDLWEDQGATGWNYENVLPYFKKMETNQNTESIDVGYHGFNGPLTVEDSNFESPFKYALYTAFKEMGYQKVDSNGRNQKGIYDCQSTTRNGQRCSTGKAYLVPAENRTNLHIVKNAFVTKIIFSKNTAIGVKYILQNKTFVCTVAKEVILSAGSINTPQLLMLSGVGPKNHLLKMRIPLTADLPVGLNLQDHVASFNVYYTNELPSTASEIVSSESLQEYIDSRKGMLSSALGQLYSAFLTNKNGTPDDAVPDYQLLFVANAFSQHTIKELNIQEKVYEQVFKPYENKSTIQCFSLVLQPKSRGSVKLRSSNPYDFPIIDPNYFTYLSDLRNLIKGLKTCDRIFRSEPFKSLGLKPIEIKYPGCEMYDRFTENYLLCSAKAVAQTAYHPTSTAKMGELKDPTVVVDPLLKVKGLRRLRIVDASVMPIIPSGNTNIPTIMIAEKAADIIKNEIQCQNSNV